MLEALNKTNLVKIIVIVCIISHGMKWQYNYMASI